MSDEDEDGAENESHCPFCKSSSDCEHLLLLVDLTFRMAVGGALYDAFDGRWSAISEDTDATFDASEAFDELLDEVDCLSDASWEYVVEGGPGMTSKYAVHFCSSKDRVASVVKAFEVQ